MTKELLFWILMLVWLLWSATPLFRRSPGAPLPWPVLGESFIAWAAVAVLGWAYFGQPVH